MSERSKLRARIEELGPWYHFIDFGNGVVTPGDRDQSLVFAMYRDHFPVDLTEKTVLDLGANAAGLSIEFARRGASVTAVEVSGHYYDQAHFVVEQFGLADRVEILQCDIYSLADWSRRFDIVCYMGLSYHVPYPQLALDMLSHLCDEQLISSTQTVPGDTLSLHNRARHLVDREQDVLHGWEPTESLFLSMLAHAGFRNPDVISTAPHPGETAGRLCGNRSYFAADAPAGPTPLPFTNDPGFTGRAQDRHKRRAQSARSE